MKKNEFLLELEDILQREECCDGTDILEDYDEWDSLSKMAVMGYYKKNFNIQLNLNDFKKVRTVTDLMRLAGGNIND